MLKYTVKSKEVLSFANYLASEYKLYDKDLGYYEIYSKNIPDVLLDELYSLIIKEEPEWAHDAIFEHEQYEKSFLPALIKYLSNSTDKSNVHDFLETMKSNIRFYMDDLVNEILQQSLQDIMEDSSWAA